MTKCKNKIGFSTGFETTTEKNNMAKKNFIDLSKFGNKQLKVSVNGKATDLNIGDVFLLGQSEETERMVTVGSIMIGGNGTVSYLCEYNDGMEVHTEPFTIEELQRFNKRV